MCGKENGGKKNKVRFDDKRGGRDEVDRGVLKLSKKMQRNSKFTNSKFERLEQVLENRCG